MSYIGRQGGLATRNVYKFVPTSSGTTLSGQDSFGRVLSMPSAVDLIDVFFNGVLLIGRSTDYSVTKTTLTFTSAYAANDEIIIITTEPFSVADMVKASTGGTFEGGTTHNGGITGTTGTFSGAVSAGSISATSIGATSVANISINSQGSYLGNYRAIGWGGTSNGNTHIYSQYNTVDDLVLHGGTGKGIIFESGGSSADRMVLDSNGNLGMSVNTPTSHSGWQPKLHIKHDSPSPAIILEDTTHSSDNAQANVGYTGTGLYLDVGGHTSSNNLYIRTSTNAASMGNPRFEVNVNGEIRMNDVYDDTTSNSANMYIHSDGTHQLMRSTSSERFKKDIETLEDKYADAILGLRPVWYKSKCEKDNPNHSHWGFIAEEVAKIDPRLVTYRYETSTYKQNETTKELELVTTKLDEPLVESVQYDRLVPHLINICKRQEDKITALEARIKALEEA